MRINEEGWRLLTFWMFTTGGYLILLFVVICLAFCSKRLVACCCGWLCHRLRWFFCYGLLRMMKRFSSRLAQGGCWGSVYCWRYWLATDYANHTIFGPGAMWSYCCCCWRTWGIFSIGIIGAMPIRHSRWRKKRCYEKSIRLMTAFFKSFDVASHAAAKRRGLGDE